MLSEIGMVDAWLENLEYANRPAFVLDLASESAQPIHYNKLLQTRSSVRRAVDNLLKKLTDKHLNGFCKWAMIQTTNEFPWVRDQYAWIGR